MSYYEGKDMTILTFLTSEPSTLLKSKYKSAVYRKQFQKFA